MVAFWREESQFPNGGGGTTEARLRVYWNCITAWALSLRRYHSSDCGILVATNDTPPEELAPILDDMKVELRDIPFLNPSPKGETRFGAAWYLVDVISHVADTSAPDRVTIFIDPDCLITAPLDGLIAQVRQNGLMLYGFPRALEFFTKSHGEPVAAGEVDQLARLMSLRGPPIRELAFIFRSALADLKACLTGKVARYRRE